MQDVAQRFQSVDRVEILTLVDNYVDLLAPDVSGVTRPPLARKGKVPRDTLLAEHGLSLLVGVQHGESMHCLLLDSGYNSGTVLHNMEYLNVDPRGIEAVVLSHGHMDHMGGLRRLLEKLVPGVPVVAHPDVFRKRCLVKPNVGRIDFPEVMQRSELSSFHAGFLDATAPVFLAEDTILVTGEIPRTTAFERGMPGAHTEDQGRLVPDTIPDDQAVIIKLAGHGLVVISGCAHSGIINSILYAIHLTGESRVAAVIGGFHLSGPDTDVLVQDTLNGLREISPSLIMPMHCTGWNAMARLQREFSETFVLSTVGTRLVLPRGV